MLNASQLASIVARKISWEGLVSWEVCLVLSGTKVSLKLLLREFWVCVVPVAQVPWTCPCQVLFQLLLSYVAQLP